MTTVTDDIELVRALANTLDREDGVDVLDRGWLADRGLLARGEEPPPEAMSRLARVREAVRDLLSANNGVAVERARAVAVLDEAAGSVGLAVRFRGDGVTSVEASEDSGDRATGRVLAAVASLLGTDEWPRLKACRWEPCRWAFYDASRNRSRAWCSMAACGNRAKARAYRARH